MCQDSPLGRKGLSTFKLTRLDNKGALDAGAHGVMVPLLTSVEDAETIVQWSNFPPRGKRGWGSPFPMNAFAPTRGKPELSSVQYMQQAHDALLTVVQIETQGALDSVEKIAAVPGIDVLFVGPFDLGNNIGAPILEGEQDQKLKDAIRRVLDAAVAAGKKAGIYCISGEQAKGYIDMGFHMVGNRSIVHHQDSMLTYIGIGHDGHGRTSQCYEPSIAGSEGD